MAKGFLLVLLFVALTGDSRAEYYGNYYCQPGRDVIVHLFEWKWTDIQAECSWLAQHNFCGVQVSPPNEHRIVYDPPYLYPWWQRYQPVSYKLGKSRSGTEAEFRQMVSSCNNLGVYIFVDAVINHMARGGSGHGSFGSYYNADTLDYPGVPYSSWDFNGSPQCYTSDGNIHDYQDANQVRNCRLEALRDLNGGKWYVRQKVAEYLNTLISLGVAGFRIDACKHMWPGDLSATLSALNNLDTEWFPAGTKPYIYQEVIDMGGEPIKATDYKSIGRVSEFKHGKHLGDVVRKNYAQKMKWLVNFGESWGQLHALDAVVFIDNHDNQRGHGAGGFDSILTFFDSNMYKIANAFQLAWQYGHVRLMSSYNWPRSIVNGKDQNDWMGPPSDGNGNTRNAVCFDGNWICEHRWRQIFNMVKFHNTALHEPVNYSNWWDNGNNAIAFGRGTKAFIIINNEDYSISQRLRTGLPAGQYCDVISCDNNRPPCGNLGGHCRAEITVDAGGYATFDVPNGEDPMIAIHV